MAVLTLGDKLITLSEGENLLWQGRPVQGVLRNPVHIGGGVLLIVAGLLAISNTAILWAVPLLLAGGYLVFYHAIVEKNRRAGTYYAITNQRAILAYSLRVLVFPLNAASEITLKTTRFETILFSDGRPIGAHQGRIGFGHLENGQEVYKLLMKIKTGGLNGA